MSLSINKKNKKSTKLSSSSSLLANGKANATITAASVTATANPPLTRKRAIFTYHQQQQQQYKRKPKITKTTSKITSPSSLIALTPALRATSNINVGDTLFSILSTTITEKATGSSAEVEAIVKSSEAAKKEKVDHKIFRTTVMPSFKIMSYQNIIALLTVLVCGLVTVNGLKCYMCGQYNEGVGSITPCLNYSEQYAHLYLKECSKKSEKYCVVSGPVMYFYFHLFILINTIIFYICIYVCKYILSCCK